MPLLSEMIGQNAPVFGDGVPGIDLGRKLQEQQMLRPYLSQQAVQQGLARRDQVDRIPYEELMKKYSDDLEWRMARERERQSRVAQEWSGGVSNQPAAPAQEQKSGGFGPYGIIHDQIQKAHQRGGY